MTQLSNKDIFKWLTGAFPVASYSNGEACFPCPICEHPRFYFNINKRIGYCHRASCHAKPTLNDLIDIVGYSPELAGYVPGFEEEKSIVTTEVILPVAATPVFDHDIQVQEFLIKERNLTREKIFQYNILSTWDQIIVPIYYQGQSVQFVGRFIDRRVNPISKVSGRRYNYFKGKPITHYLFDWHNFSKLDKIILVENTFNAMWLSELGVTTNFGSFLSNEQIKLIKKSKVKEVTFLWDEGAYCGKAISALKSVGVYADYVSIKGQPDNYKREDLSRLLG